MAQQGSRSVGRTIRLLATVVVALLVVWLGFWAFRTYTIDQPYDELWIGMNASMPAPLRHWSCDTVKARLTQPGLAPHGCQDRW